MARMPRFFCPGLPLHVIQRGNNRAPIFRSSADFTFVRESVYHSARKRNVAVHAYVFMTNHLHMLVTPETASSLPTMMQAIGRVYVQYFNSTHGRTGTLREGRYKATVVDEERYLLTCMRYIELNPVRAQMVSNPGDYPWSSFRANAHGAMDKLVAPHDAYLALDTSMNARRAAYRDLFGQAIEAADLCAIRDATQNAWALGSAAFCEKIAAATRRGSRMMIGRPRKTLANHAKVESDPT